MVQHKRLSLCVFIDALGWELVRIHPFLDDVLVTKVPLKTIFGYSSTCDPTILTGKMPRDHGHFAFFRYDPEASPFRRYRVLEILPKFLANRGRVRNGVSKVVQQLLGYTGYFQLYNMPFRHLHLFDYSEKRDLYQPGGINSGVPTVFDYLREHKIPFFLSDWRTGETANLAAFRRALTGSQVTFAYLFLAAMDAILHAHGTNSPRVAEKIQWYETELRRILEEAYRHYKEVRLFVFSDHGMTNIVDTCDLMARIKALGLRFGEDYAAAYDSTMARFWFLKDGVREAIVGALEAEPKGYILSDAELAEWGCDFPNAHYGELFFLMAPGILLCPSFMGKKPLSGMHGYAPDDKGSTAAFMSNVTPDPMPKRLDDLCDLMLHEAKKWREAR